MDPTRAIGSFRASGIPLLDIHELAASKLAALLGSAVRDLYDAHQLFTGCHFDCARRSRDRSENQGSWRRSHSRETHRFITSVSIREAIQSRPTTRADCP